MKQSKGRKLFLYSALGIFLTGVILFLAGYTMGGRLGIYIDDKTIHTAEGVFDRKTKKRVENPEGGIAYSQPKMEVEPFTEFDIKLKDADLEIIPSDGYYLQYELNDLKAPVYGAEDGVFTFLQGKNQEKSFNGQSYYLWIGKEGLGWKEEQKKECVKLYLPKDAVIERATVWEDDGDLTAGAIHMKDLDVNLGYGGNFTLDSWEGDALDVYLKSGDFQVNGGLHGAQSCRIESSHGNFAGGELTAPEASVTLENGSMSLGKAARDMVLTAEVQYGVTLGLEGKLDDYNFFLEAQRGELQVPWAENELIFRDDSTGRESVNRQDNAELAGKIRVTSRQGKIIVRENQ